jgi:anti-sigma B factor antagonist
MTVECRMIQRCTVLAVSSEVDLASAPYLRSAVDNALDACAHELRIDLSITTFLDSSGVHLLTAAHRRARDLRRRLAIAGRVRRALDLAGIADALPLYADLRVADRVG